MLLLGRRGARACARWGSSNVRFRPIADVRASCEAERMNRWVRGSLVLVAAVTSACTRPIHVTLAAGRDYQGLWTEYAYSNVGESQWAAIDAKVPTTVARSIRRWQLNNVTLWIFRCNDPKNFFPAF